MDAATTFITLGMLLLVALLADRLAQRSPLPQVTVLLLVGVVASPAVLDLLPQARETWEPVVTDIALVMVGFLIGSDLEWRRLRGHGPSMLLLAVIAAVITAAVVTGGLLLIGADSRLAFALGGIAAATDPASTLAVVDEERSEGPLTRTLLGIVAVDDAISITLFSLLVATAVVITGGGEITSILLDAVREIGGGILLGVAIGVPAAFLTGRLQPGRPTLLEALALVFFTAGLGELLEVSFLLAAIVAGAVVANFAAHHDRAFHEIERIDWPFLAVFFLLGGASFRIEGLRTYAGLVAAYVILRAVGRIIGGMGGSIPTSAPEPVRRHIGFALLPQAGVALGLALLVRERFPEVAEVVIPVAVISTVIFELIGPAVTRAVLHRTGEAGAATDQDG